MVILVIKFALVPELTFVMQLLLLAFCLQLPRKSIASLMMMILWTVS
jgi:hypothetical protein